jgi:CRP/FNR family transcriptional regulator, cyclic AMP receptor protein
MYKSGRDVLGDGMWARLCQLAPQHHRTSRSVLLRQDDPGTHVLVLEQGAAILTRRGSNGGQVLLAVRNAGNLLGEQAVLDDGVRSCTVVAAEPCRVRIILAADFRRFVATHGLYEPLLRQAISRAREADEIRLELATAPVAVRLASGLTLLARAFTRQRGQGVPVPLTQEELALLIGASRNSVSQTLALWRGNGWLRTTPGGGLVLTDVAALRREAERPGVCRRSL